jgi:hypothetical protein
MKSRPLRKSPAAPGAAQKERHERRVAGLLSEREALMEEISLRARIGALPPMLAKARTLLTNFWAKADWQARSELLPAARMLLVLGAAQPALGTAGSSDPRKSGAAKPSPSRRRKTAAAAK